ncbi:hypothetical protein BpHYR1_046601 [Brachionus plicatilis]|uniref:Uncharacterized protein n=1 Tax=Brachionus plicatilis TaxID=10195 RepID=A0A3M7S3K0_BRAPC|nr:hypothetical protein BpHYR1_046601 [Brachionus plicatilis]
MKSKYKKTVLGTLIRKGIREQTVHLTREKEIFLCIFSMHVLFAKIDMFILKSKKLNNFAER